MNVLLVCPRVKGNTFEVCNYVSKNCDAELLVINQREIDDLKNYKTIILSSGVYADTVHKNILRWIAKLEKRSMHKNAKIYVFLTWFGRGKSDKKAIQKVKYELGKKKIDLEDDHFTCYGGKGPIRTSHPNTEDYNNVLNWVKSKNS